VVADCEVTVVMGINEVIKKGKGNSTIYNSIITIDKNGNLLFKVSKKGFRAIIQ
jgi:apolipoprotein N-acyltransferase